MEFDTTREAPKTQRTKEIRCLLENHKNRLAHLEAILLELGGYKKDLLSIKGWRILLVDENPSLAGTTIEDKYFGMPPKTQNYWGLHHTFNKNFIDILSRAGFEPTLTGPKGRRQILIKPHKNARDTYLVLYALCCPFYEAIGSLQKGIIWTTENPSKPIPNYQKILRENKTSDFLKKGKGEDRLTPNL